MLPWILQGTDLCSDEEKYLDIKELKCVETSRIRAVKSINEVPIGKHGVASIIFKGLVMLTMVLMHKIDLYYFHLKSIKKLD